MLESVTLAKEAEGYLVSLLHKQDERRAKQCEGNSSSALLAPIRSIIWGAQIMKGMKRDIYNYN